MSSLTSVVQTFAEDRAQFGERADQWSLGVILYLCACCQPIRCGFAKNKKYLDLPKGLQSVIEGLVKRDPAERFTADQVLRSSYILEVARPSASNEAQELASDFADTWANSAAVDFASLRPSSQPVHIEHTEDRGISPGQLQDLCNFLTATIPNSGWSDWNGVALASSTINLYDVNKYVILPMTEGDQCSYIEAIASNAIDQRPNWFVSHWWGEPVLDFTKCLCEHAEKRGLESAVFWVCAYSKTLAHCAVWALTQIGAGNNQHNLSSELGSIDPRDSVSLQAEGPYQPADTLNPVCRPSLKPCTVAKASYWYSTSSLQQCHSGGSGVQSLNPPCHSVC